MAQNLKKNFCLSLGLLSAIQKAIMLACSRIGILAWNQCAVSACISAAMSCLAFLIIKSMTSEQLRQWQREMNYSQRAAAKALGVSLATYNDKVTGKSRTTGKPITIPKIWAIACAAVKAGLIEYN